MIDCFFRLKAIGTIRGNTIVELIKFVIRRIVIMDKLLSVYFCVEIRHKGTGGKSPRKVIFNPQTKGSEKKWTNQRARSSVGE